MKIILHVNESEKLKIALMNIENISHVEPNAIIELLIHGEAILMLDHEEVIQKMRTLKKETVFYSVCHFSVDKFHFDLSGKTDLLNVVPSGMVELAKK